MSTDPATQPLPPLEDNDGPLGPLPRLSARSVRLRAALARGEWGERLRAALGWLTDHLGSALQVGAWEVLDRPEGLAVPGVVAQASWAGRSARLGLGLETPLVHALIDRLLGYERRAGEERLQVTPVEWGILTFVLARTLDDLDDTGGPPALLLDQLGPEPFDPSGLGPVATVRWPVRLGAVAGWVRLWLPVSLVRAGPLGAAMRRPAPDPEALRRRFGALTGIWRAEAGTVTLSSGLTRLRVGGILPIAGAQLGGTPASPVGQVELTLRDRLHCYRFAARCVPLSGGGRLTLIGPLEREPLPREALAVTPPSGPDPTPPPSPDPETPARHLLGTATGPPGYGPTAPAEVPVTLVVELGRVHLTVQQVADLRPGDVLTLARHAREPVELTSGGKLVARGELVQIDTELGVRVTNVFL